MNIAETVQNHRAELAKMPRAYELNVSDVFELIKEIGAPLSDTAFDKVFDTITEVYQYGFIRGRNYAVNRNRRAK